MEQTIRDKIVEMAIACGITDNYQHEIIFDESRIVHINKARGIGITTAISFQKMVQILLPEIWENPQRENIIISASDEQARHLIEYIREFWGKLSSQFSQKLKTGKDKIETEGGRVIMSLACNPDAIRTWHGSVVFDEFAYFKKELDRDFFKACSGVLTTGGQVHYISNPNGERGVFYDLRESKGIKHYILPYTKCRRKLYREAVAEQKKQLLSWEFDEEYCCMYNPPSRGAIPNELIDRCIDKELEVNEYRRTENQLLMGIDFAKLVDQTAIIILEKLDLDVLKVFWIDAFRGDYNEQLEYIERLDTSLDTSIIKYDKTGVGIKLGEDLEKKLGMKLEGMTFTNSYKDKLFHKLKIKMLDRKLIIPFHEQLIEQLKNLKRKASAGGTIQYSGKEDDLVWALALAVDCADDEMGEYKTDEIPKIEDIKRGAVNSIFQRREKRGVFGG